MINKFIIICILFPLTIFAQSTSYNYSAVYDGYNYTSYDEYPDLDNSVDEYPDLNNSEKYKDNDPIEPVNRIIFGFNMLLDTAIIEPLSNVYTNLIPYYGRKRVTSFFANLNTPIIFTNDMLQLETNAALTSFWRFVINSTFGIAGLFDVASEMNLKKNNNSLGKTLIKWGFNPGPYLVLPIFGPSSLTASIGTIGDTYLDYKIFHSNKMRHFKKDIRILKLLNIRSNSATIINNIKYKSLDPYIAARSMYLQNKSFLYNNSPKKIEDSNNVTR